MLVLACALAFVAGAKWGGRTQTADAYCLSTHQQITCTTEEDGTGRDILVPTDVSWAVEGEFPRGGRPDCLPPVGIGALEVNVTYESVDIGGYEQYLATFVDCGG